MIKHEDGSVTVESKKELAELLMSEPGVKWTSDYFNSPDKVYCYFDEGYTDPFRFNTVNDESIEMLSRWDIKKWRKVKPQFKKYDVVLCWNDYSVTACVLRVYGNKGSLFEIDATGISSDRYDNCELYTGPIPKHIQTFIDEMKAKEK